MEILMKEASPRTDFLEIEAIEFDRRVDLAYSAIPATLRIFAELAQVRAEQDGLELTAILFDTPLCQTSCRL